MHGLKNMIIKPLIIVGGLNWGLVGLLNFDLVAAIFGAGSVLSHIVYSLVGIAAVVYLYMSLTHKSHDSKK